MAKYDYLIIAEKNTLASDIAKAFKKYKREGNFFVAEDPELGKAKITWLFGHILEPDIEGTMGERKWAGAPVYPKWIKLKVKKGREKLFKDVKNEIQKGEYRFIVHAGDPDREGELLVRELLNYLKVPKEKVLRMWFNSQQAHELRRALKEAKPLKEYDHLYTAAQLRQWGDLVVGINASRAVQHGAGDFNLSVGRVQTPVLKIIADRYLEHKNFKPEEYYVVSIWLEKGKKFKANYVKEKEGLVEKEEADKVLSAVKPQKYAKVVSVSRKKNKKFPPKMYTLTYLLKDAEKLGINKDKAYKIIQGLYEKRKVISYPRTESPHLSTNDVPLVKRVLKMLETESPDRDFYRKILSSYGMKSFSDRLKPQDKRIFNDKSVAEAGHHAIIPIGILSEDATKEEKLIYDLVLKRFLAQFLPPYEYETTTVIFECGGYKFQARGKVDVSPGWRAIYGKLNLEDEKEEEEANQSLPSLEKGEAVKKVGESISKKFTQPPPLFSSGNLLIYLEKLGIGTEATRPMIENILKDRQYIVEQKRKLIPTERGFKLLEVVKDTPIVSPEVTAQWEKALADIALRRNYSRVDEFKKGIQELTDTLCRIIVNSDKVKELARKPSEKMVNYALYLAREKGVEVDEERLKTDYNYAKEFIDKHKLPPKPPSEAQLEFARKLAEETGLKPTDKDLETSSSLKKWIDKALRKKKGSSKGKRRKTTRKTKKA